MRSIRINLVFVTAILICFGIIMIYSASSIFAWDKLGDTVYFLKRQLLYICMGLVLTGAVMMVDYRKLSEYARPLAIVSLVLLILLLVPGVTREVAGAKRWFRILGYSFQPSELAKLAVIIYMADLLSRRQNKTKFFFGGFVPAMVVLGLFVLPVLAQPDLGTAVAITVVVFTMLFVAGTRLTHLISVIMASMPFLYILIFSVPYRRARMMAFLNPWNDPRGSGFQIIQSQIALGSGGLLGVGLGQSQQKLFYLPAAHTDFIFSIIGEELGFVGAAAVIVLFIMFLWLASRIMKYASDNFGKLVCSGIITLIGFETLINIGVSIGVFPTKGLPLPFISYGGTSLIFNMVSVGILLNISRSSEA